MIDMNSTINPSLNSIETDYSDNTAKGYTRVDMSMVGNQMVASLRNTNIVIKMGLETVKEKGKLLFRLISDELNPEFVSTDPRATSLAQKLIGLNPFKPEYEFSTIFRDCYMEVFEGDPVEGELVFLYEKNGGGVISGPRMDVSEKISTAALLNYLCDLKDEYAEDTAYVHRNLVLEAAINHLIKHTLAQRRAGSL